MTFLRGASDCQPMDLVTPTAPFIVCLPGLNFKSTPHFPALAKSWEHPTGAPHRTIVLAFNEYICKRGSMMRLALSPTGITTCTTPQY